MLKIINYCLDLLFPPRRTELTVRRVTSQELTTLFRPDNIQNVRFLTTYSNPLIEALIKENKYYENTRAARALAEIITLWIQTQPSRRLVLVPIPQSILRAREREHNQVESILKYIKLPEFVTINTQLIQKSRHTPTQTSLKRKARFLNVRDSFSLLPHAELASLSGATIVIVDDVVTTGATMDAARTSLAPHLPQNTDIILLALAH